MSEAVMKNDDTMGFITKVIKEAKDGGVSLSKIAEHTKVNRALISSIYNHGQAIVPESGRESLYKWAKQYRHESQAMPDNLLIKTNKNKEIEIIPTASYMEGLGMCRFAEENRALVIITGKPGTGKTTIVKKLPEVLKNPVCIEAYPMMRMGDMLRILGDKIGVRTSGSLFNKTMQIEQALKGSDITLVIDEAEMLRKWDNDKLEVLRKIWDHTGISLIMFGTPMLESIVSRMNTTQLSRRMFSLKLRGASKKEVREALKEYNITDEAADELSRIAADTDRGGMGTFAMLLKLCLKAAEGGLITDEILADAKQYKPGI